MNLILSVLIFISVPVKASDIIIEEGLKAFEKTLYPALRTSCVQCHGDGGIAIGHSVSNVREAYLNAKQLVDLPNAESSRFAIKVRAKHWLRHDPTARGMELSQIIAYLKAWWEAGENKANVKFDIVSAPVSIPEGLPEMKDGKYLTLYWDLTAWIGCSASVEIQRAKFSTDTVPGAYRVRNPKMKCQGQSIEVQSLYFAVTQELRQFENIYSTVKATLPKSGEEILLSQDIMINPKAACRHPDAAN